MKPLSNSEHQTMDNIAAFVCSEGDSLWVGVERALDNGAGVVFVTDADGRLTGQASRDAMRAAVKKGAHLSGVKMAEVMTPYTASAFDPVVPNLDGDRRIVSVTVRPEASFLPVAEPDLTHAELRNVMDAFLSTWISSAGEYLSAFEKRFAASCDMAHGVATSNGTVSLHLAMTALGIGEGDEVIVPDFTFAASASTVMHTGAKPVLVDVDPTTWCVTAEAIEAAITPRTRAVMPVHVFGRPAPMAEIQAVARKHGIFVIEDCAEAHGATYDGRPIGSYSDVASFSFFANKIMTTGEGGICVTNNPDLALRMRILRDHGMRPERRYWHEEAAFNYRMTNLQAAIGCAQLDRMPELLAMRRAVDGHYRKAFAGTAGVDFPPELPERFGAVIWFACAQVPAERRPAMIDACKRANIDLRPFFNGLSMMPAFKRSARVCPNSRALSLSGVNLPTSRRVTEDMAFRIAEVMKGELG